MLMKVFNKGQVVIPAEIRKVTHTYRSEALNRLILDEFTENGDVMLLPGWLGRLIIL